MYNSPDTVAIYKWHLEQKTFETIVQVSDVSRFFFCELQNEIFRDNSISSSFDVVGVEGLVEGVISGVFIKVLYFVIQAKNYY